jgi:hypothetical protein
MGEQDVWTIKFVRVFKVISISVYYTHQFSLSVSISDELLLHSDRHLKKMR